MVEDQHFMVDQALLQEIASYAEKWDNVLEIGAGKGALTQYLTKRAKRVYAIEKDQEFIPELEEKFANIKNVVFMFDDALKVEYPKFDKCISNLPYSICEPLLWKFLRLDFTQAVWVVPENFADILIGKSWSKLNFILPMFFGVKKIKTISKEAFDPQPSVRSALVVLTPRQSDNPLKKIYMQYDKKLRNALRELFMDQGINKREASLKASSLFSKEMLDKKVQNLSAQELQKLISGVN